MILANMMSTKLQNFNAKHNLQPQIRISIDRKLWLMVYKLVLTFKHVDLISKNPRQKEGRNERGERKK